MGYSKCGTAGEEARNSASSVMPPQRMGAILCIQVWDGGLQRAESKNEPDFDFQNSIMIRIEGEPYPNDYRYTHVIIENGKWYMF